ncbi:MAG: lipopolysaccharide biosynthesis protein [Gammaproteobacteria bacterium]|nr:lipopolysaccharide biosynthesis protein [Gammaproteobacteria bacterium]
MIAMRLFDRGLAVASTVVLARLLSPVDYGIVAIAAGCTEFLYLLAAFGFDTALIQRADANQRHYDTAWTLNILLAIAIAVGILVLAPFSAAYFHDDRLTAVLRALALNPILIALTNIGIVKFRKELAFHREAMFAASRRVSGFVLTLALALWLRSYWALVLGQIGTAAIGCLLSYLMHPHRPRVDVSESKALLSFSLWVQLNTSIRFASTTVLDFVVARMAGAAAVGVYSISGSLASLPTSELSAPINRALLPGYAKFSNDDVKLKRTVLDVFGVLGVVAMPAGIGIAATSSLLVPVVLGGEWLAAIPLVQIMAIANVLSVLQNNSYLIYMVKGRPRTTTWVSGSFALVQLALVMLFLERFGVVGVAYGTLVSRLLIAPVESALLTRTLGMRFREIAQALWRPTLACAAMAAGLHELMTMLGQREPHVGLLLAVVLAGATVYVATLGALWLLAGRPEGGERLILGMIKNYRRRESRDP